MAIYDVGGATLRGALELCEGPTDLSVRFRDADGHAATGSVTGLSISCADQAWRFVIEAEEDD